MQNTRKRFQRRDKGYGLIITIVFVGIALLLLGSMMEWTNSSANQTERNNLYSMGVSAAQATDERVLSQMMRDFYSQALNAPPTYAGLSADTTSWPVQFSFSNPSNANWVTYVSTTPSNYTTNWVKLGDPYPGDWATVAQCSIISTATTTNQPYRVPATVEEDFQLAVISSAQGFFYNMDMEISPGQDMTFNGKTFVNGNIWASPGGNLTFGDTVKCTKNYYNSRNSANDPQANGSGTITFNVGGPQTNAPPQIIPVGTNSDGSSAYTILALPPTNIDPSSQAGQTYLYNVCDLVISNAASGTNNISVYFQDTNNASRLTLITPDLIVTNGGGTNMTYSTNYSFLSNTNFYDYREVKTVNAVQLNVGALNKWLTNANGSSLNTQCYNDTGHYISSAYIYNNATASSTRLPAVRVANGSVLPSQGLTVATPDPLYVLGNYNATGAALGTTNTASTSPAGLLGDAITILSTSWSDTYTSGTGLNSRNAGSTTVNAATLEGIVVSTNFGGTKYYSGGVENFLRLLEDWSGDTLTYNGSIVVLFASQYATNYWQSPGAYYQVPTRHWGFDLNFTQQNRLPPAFPSWKQLIRQRWNTY